MAGINKLCKMCCICFKTSQTEINRGNGIFCSAECYHKSRVGYRSTNWKGGRKITSQGYVEVYKPDHPNSDSMGYVKEHRLVMSKILGRALSKKEIVHHINKDRTDNRPENLEVLSIGSHQRMHTLGVKLSVEHKLKLSKSKKAISHTIKRDENGRFLGGVSYGR